MSIAILMPLEVIRSDRTIALPLNAANVRSTPAMVLNSSPDRCPVVPMPGAPNTSLPGLARAAAMNSFRVFCGALALTTKAFGVWPTATTASKFFGLQESLR